LRHTPFHGSGLSWGAIGNGYQKNKNATDYTD
jgi:hypothetical protein